MPKYDDPANAGKARARANKMLNTYQVFEPANFKKIMNAVDPIFKAADFVNACKALNPPLDDTQINWLAVYLMQCKDAVYGTIPEAASTGW